MLRLIRSLIVVVAGMVLALSAAACHTAKTEPQPTDHLVDLQEVCIAQGEQAAHNDNKSDPFGWKCYNENRGDVPIGDLNVQAYCDLYHPGSKAVVDEEDWLCRE